ncbi:redoxin family protein [Caulobacter sp. S45]|uniref:redoxin family protein n=1 Tax=Caulobacter sp. S45 TaxID=1641861 RepID=UPI00131E5687|nr:redoxin family protein [Caulobacter sp. S45]
MKRWIALTPLAVLGTLGVLFATFGLHHDPHFTPDALVGQPAPAPTLPALDTTQPTALATARAGQPVVIDFFASWCIPCLQDAPALMAMKQEGVRVIGIAYKDDPAASRDFLAAHGDPFASVLVDRDGRTGVDFGVTGVPEAFVVSADGKVLAKHSGPMTPPDVEALLEKVQGR